MPPAHALPCDPAASARRFWALNAPRPLPGHRHEHQAHRTGQVQRVSSILATRQGQGRPGPKRRNDRDHYALISTAAALPAAAAMAAMSLRRVIFSASVVLAALSPARRWRRRGTARSAHRHGHVAPRRSTRSTDRGMILSAEQAMTLRGLLARHAAPDTAATSSPSPP